MIVIKLKVFVINKRRNKRTVAEWSGVESVCLSLESISLFYRIELGSIFKIMFCIYPDLDSGRESGPFSGLLVL